MQSTNIIRHKITENITANEESNKNQHEFPKGNSSMEKALVMAM